MRNGRAQAWDAAVSLLGKVSMSGDCWLRIVVDRAALRHNMAEFRRHVPESSRLLAVVKSDAYGHGLLTAASAFLEGGADMLGVHSAAEARALRRDGVGAPILVLGPLDRDGVVLAGRLGVEFTVSSVSGAHAASAAASAVEGPLRVHLKVETGVNRQGIVEGELDEVLGILAGEPKVKLVGLSSHFADIEDTTDHSFARTQSERFKRWRTALAQRGIADPCVHMSCSAAAILWPDAEAGLVRVGIAGYGVWPSRETFVSARDRNVVDLDLKPAVSWRCRVSQVRTVPAGETVGYGRRWKAPVESRIAVLPVGYADGYPRALSGCAHVLLGGLRAPVVGRICMNLTMVDVTHIPGVESGDEAVLLGRQGEEHVTAEDLAGWLGTIPYEVLVRPGASWTRTEVH